MSEKPPAKKLRLISPEKTDKAFAKIFQSKCVCLVEQGLGKVRSNVLERQLKKHGANVTKQIDNDTEYILVANDVKKEKVLKWLKVRNIDQNIIFVSVEWISACLVKGEFVDIEPYLAFKNSEDLIKEKIISEEKNLIIQATDKSVKPATSQSCHRGSSDSDSSFDEDSTQLPTIALPSTENPLSTLVCTKPSTSKSINHNVNITDKLAILQKNYTNTQDKWRSFGYKKAIASIQNYHKPLESYEEVSKLPFVGERLAKKIWEIIETGHLRRLDHVDSKTELLNLFVDVWGAGPKTAETWIAKGFTSLEDVANSSELTSQQKIGIKYYDDIKEKMPRSEVSEIENHIWAAAESLLKGVSLVVCGSYRRGRSFCGDIDVLVSHPDGHSHKGFLKVLLEKLKEDGLITDDLIKVENSTQRKYMGVCKLPGDEQKYRRIDFIVAPYNEWPLALIHFTGSAHLNRSMRLSAKKKNMSLSEHALRKNVVYSSDDEKLNAGEEIPIFSEEDVFKYLGLDYLEPTQRDW